MTGRCPVPADPLADRIVGAALDLAREQGWEGVRLHLVAERLEIPLTDVLERFRDLDAVADAFFRRAWAAMLVPPPAGFAEMRPRDRLRDRLMRWFAALSPDKRIAGQMLRAKLYPSHPHHWVPLVFSLSRTIQWLRDAAWLDAGGRRRQAEEIWLTGIFLAALPVWLRDRSEGDAETRDYLERRLLWWR